MDLSGGNHGLLTQNLGADNISTIQILERHQPIRALEGVRASDDVAINLKISNKRKGVWTNSLHAGVGADGDLFLTGKLTSSYLTRGRQHLFVGHYDHTGRPEADAKSGTEYTPLFPVDLRRPDAPSGVERSRYRDNKSLYGSLSNVYRLSGDAHSPYTLYILGKKTNQEALPRATGC